MAHQGTDTYNLPRAMLNEDNFDFSFSGIKSAVINLMHNAEQRGETIDLDDLASSFQAAVVEILVGKAQRALEAYPVKSFIVAGGVAANRGLRDALASMMQRFPDTEYIPVPIALAGDNAAMIGAAGDIAYRHGARAGLDLNANPALEFDYLED